MRAVVQRVVAAAVAVGGEEVAGIGPGLLALVGVEVGDASSDVAYIGRKLATLRIFDDGSGRLNRSLAEAGGEVLLVSQFTLLGDARKGTRPSYTAAMPPEDAERLYRELLDFLRAEGLQVSEGAYREHMSVTLTNDGPVTVLLDSRRSF